MWLEWIFGPAWGWPTWLHQTTGWNYWPVPKGEAVEVIRDKTVAAGTLKPWPKSVGDGREFDYTKQTLGVGNPSKVYKGSLSGPPIQNAGKGSRSVSHGYIQWGEKFQAVVPLPASGSYWIEGTPNPTWDKLCNIVDGNTVHELIGFTPDLAESQFLNQALGYSKWVDGVLKEGRSSSATGVQVSKYIWTPWSAITGGHKIGMIIADYVGADGLLSEGIPAGCTLVLDKNSESYKREVAAGGERRALAEALAIYGANVRDRNGYNDSDNFKVGKVPQAPTLTVQPTAHWNSTNIDKFGVSLGDMRLLA